MAGGLFQGLSKLLDAGATYLQHQQFAERLRGMQLEEAKGQLATYIGGMSDAGFNGLKLALALLAKNTKEPGTSKLLNGLLESLDAARQNLAQGIPSETATPVPLVDTAPARSFDDDLALVAGWHELDQDGRIAALSTYLADLAPNVFNTFREHVSQMVANVEEQIRRHEANENKAWGGFAEDRMSYMLARLQTGQRDPAFLARLRELHDYRAFSNGWAGRLISSGRNASGNCVRRKLARKPRPPIRRPNRKKRQCKRARKPLRLMTPANSRRSRCCARNWSRG